MFRILFGLLVLGEAFRWLAHGWIDEYLVAPPLLFKYYGLEWVTAGSRLVLHAHFVLLGGFAALVALGVCFRVAVVALVLAFGYVFALNQAAYLNQYVLLLSVAMLLCVVPADREYALGHRPGPDGVAPSVPRWSLWALRLMFETLLIHAGLVKLNADWLAGQPLGLWFAELAVAAPAANHWLTAQGLNVAASYAVVVLHLVGAPLLLWRRTRLAVFVVYVAFHLANSAWLRIGLFPWITLAGTLLFFDPGWPREIAARLGFASRSTPGRVSTERIPASPWVAAALAIFFLAQWLVPLRHLLYPGNVAWTGEGSRFAWRMKLDDRRGTARFVLTEPVSARRWDLDPGTHLPPRQVEAMLTDPDMILQFAHYLARTWRQRLGVAHVSVHVHATCALNGRPPAPWIDPRVDLARVERTWRHYEWILPGPPARLAAAPSGP